MRRVAGALLGSSAMSVQTGAGLKSYVIEEKKPDQIPQALRLQLCLTPGGTSSAGLRPRCAWACAGHHEGANRPSVCVPAERGGLLLLGTIPQRFGSESRRGSRAVCTGLEEAEPGPAEVPAGPGAGLPETRPCPPETACVSLLLCSPPGCWPPSVRPVGSPSFHPR